MSGPLHALDPELLRWAMEWIAERLSGEVPLGGQATRAALAPPDGSAFTAGGGGADAAWTRFTSVIAPANVGLASPRFLAFIPAAPSPASVLMDAVVSAASFSAESWMEASGAVHAENEVLAELASWFGLPVGAGGCFVSGGSAGNLSALAVAREARPGRALAVADTAHSSVGNAARLLGLEVVGVPTDPAGRLAGPALQRVVDEHDIGAVVAAAGATNAGTIDDLDGVATVCERNGLWLHVDAAYGGAAILVESVRPRFVGIERADSLIVDPHKWLFGPLGSCALLYRDPAQAARVHTQHASYLDVLHHDEGEWNPADYAHQLTRRAAGLPLWFALSVHGIDAHAAAVGRGIELARYAARRLGEIDGVELVAEPELSVVVFRRAGWGADDWRSWCSRLLEAGIAFVTPTRWRGEVVGRLVFLHPATTEAIVDQVVGSLGSAEWRPEPGDG